MDARYIQSVHKEFGLVPMRTFPNLWISLYLYWTAWRRIKVIRPLYYIDYNKSQAKEFLTSRFGWQCYGGHHLENRFTAFYHSYFLPRRFGIDTRLLGYSAQVRSANLVPQSFYLKFTAPDPPDPRTVSNQYERRADFLDHQS